MKPDARPDGYVDIGSADQLESSGPGIVVDMNPGDFLSGFAIRHAGQVHAYLNRCPHNGTPLDWVAGDFFDETGRYLVCATHGALFDPQTGKCLKGPCMNKALTPLPVKLEGNRILVRIVQRG